MTRTGTLTYSANDIASALDMHTPTDEQRAVIEAPLAPLLVVAGAGSGKTETMASRVIWLVANGLVEPDQVLGLTFTRKAATELAERITQRLRRLQRAGLWTPPEDDDDAETLGGTPTVSTYHSYAGRLVREHALRLGYESESRLLSEAAAWQYAAEVVSRYDGPMDAVAKAESTITAAVVDLAGEMAEHLLTPADVREYLGRVDAALAALPQGSSRAKDLPAETRKVRDALRERAAVLPMVERYLGLKRERDAMDFADQMALAARLATRFDDIGAIERQRFRAVLLDEFQDTSEAQLELLRALFVAPGEPVPVTAVGDPNQSIYGWRGASATTLSRFPRAFREETEALQLPLSTSWRNHRAILAVANHVAAPLRAAAKVHVEELRPSPAAGPGRVSAARLLTVEDEAAHVAEWIAARRSAGAESAAVLCRKRSQFAPIIDALESREIPYEVVGLGGLLLTPEIEDIVALLHVVQDPTRGDQLMRLLTGPLCRLGPADLDGLMAWARHQQRVRSGLSPEGRAGGTAGVGAAGGAGAAGGPGAGGGPDAIGGPVPDVAGVSQASSSDGSAAAGAVREQAPDAVDQPSIVEAVDDLPRPGWQSHGGQWISDAALARLTGLQQVIRRLRSLTGLPLADLVGEAERVLGLDIEVLSRPGYTPAAARAHLDAFADVAAGFTASADRPNLAGFLSWLEAALKEERGLDKGYIEASPDAVQVLTVHAAKGLEWDAVAVPGLVEGSFPALGSSRSSHNGTEWAVPEPKDRGWCGGLSGVPYDLRGDRDGLPVWEWRSAEDWTDIEAKTGEFIRAGGEHGVVEERRLAYVAFTRARGEMLLTAPVWAAPGTPRVTSRFLTEVIEASAAAGLPVERLAWADMPGPDRPETCQNPRDAEILSVAWPAEQHRADVLVQAAAAVRTALATDVPRASAPGRDAPAQAVLPLPGDEVPLLEELDLLLAERARLARRTDEVVAVPRHLSTSALVALAQDASAFASGLRRPMPQAPALAARRGTAFHAWVEQHYARAAMVDLLDMPGSADEDPGDDAELPAMKAHFLASEWANRTPVEIEIAVETVIDAMAVRGRIDAVFRRPGGGFTVVDWKTGSKPSGEMARTRALQLAAYRVAFARLRGLDLADVDAAFYYAGSGETVWPDLPDESGLAGVLGAIPSG